MFHHAALALTINVSAMDSINLSAVQVDLLHNNLLDAWTQIATRNPWNDSFWAAHEPYSVTLMYGQNSPFTLDSPAGFNSLESQISTEHNCALIDRYVVALAYVQYASYANQPVPVVGDRAGITHQFTDEEDRVHKHDIYPVAFSKDICNVQARGVPNFLAKRLATLNTTHSQEDNTEPPLRGIRYQGYGSDKTVYRHTRQEHDAVLGEETACLVACGTTGSHVIKRDRFIRRINDTRPWERTRDRVVASNPSLGHRSEAEYAIILSNLPREKRNARFIVHELIKPMILPYTSKTHGKADFRSTLRVLKPGVIPSALLDCSIAWECLAATLWKQAMTLTDNGRKYCSWDLIEGIAIATANIALCQTGDLRVTDTKIYQSSGMLAALKATGVPTLDPSFWPAAPEGRLLPDAWPRNPVTNVPRSLAFRSAKYHFNADVAYAYLSRFKIELHLELYRLRGALDADG
ncbi:hypothetical protein CALCODRAFT_489128, partial [Calocera cornea HHB12733]